MWTLADALNMLDGNDREMLVLYHIEALSTNELAQLFDKSIAEVRLPLHAAESRLTVCLSELSEEAGLLVGDVCLWLADLGAALDFEQPCELASLN